MTGCICTEKWGRRGVGEGMYLHPQMGCVGVSVAEQGVSAPRDGVHVLAGWLLVMKVYLHSGMGGDVCACVCLCVAKRVYLHPGKGRVSAEGCWWSILYHPGGLCVVWVAVRRVFWHPGMGCLLWGVCLQAGVEDDGEEVYLPPGMGLACVLAGGCIFPPQVCVCVVQVCKGQRSGGAAPAGSAGRGVCIGRGTALPLGVRRWVLLGVQARGCLCGERS